MKRTETRYSYKLRTTDRCRIGCGVRDVVINGGSTYYVWWPGVAMTWKGCLHSAVCTTDTNEIEGACMFFIQLLELTQNLVSIDALHIPLINWWVWRLIALLYILTLIPVYIRGTTPFNMERPRINVFTPGLFEEKKPFFVANGRLLRCHYWRGHIDDICY